MTSKYGDVAILVSIENGQVGLRLIETDVFECLAECQEILLVSNSGYA